MRNYKMWNSQQIDTYGASTFIVGEVSFRLPIQLTRLISKNGGNLDEARNSSMSNFNIFCILLPHTFIFLAVPSITFYFLYV